MEGYVCFIIFCKLIVIKVYEDYKDLKGDFVDLMGYKLFIVERFYCLCEKEEVCVEVVNNFFFIMRKL